MIMPKGLRALAASFAPIALASAALVTATGTAAQSTPTPPPGCTGPASQTWLNVVAEGLKNGEGLLAVTLYADDSSKFLVKRGSL